MPVYVYLAGATVGSLIPSSYNVEPVYGGIEIEKMRVKALDAKTNDFIEGTPDFFKPNKVDVDTLGYLVVTLKQFDADNFEICNSNADCDDGFMCETGACYPTEINLSFTAEIWFKEAERLYSLSKSALILSANSDEDQWIEDLESNAAMYSFFGGRGLVRVRDIDDNTVYLTVYSNKDLYWPIIEAPRPIADIVLDKGETSEYIDLGSTDEQVLKNAMFRITLNDLRDPLMDMGIMTDTLETAVMWDNLIPLYTAVRKYLKSRGKTVAMVHISHVYQNGANLYFTFLSPMKKNDEINDYLLFHKGLVDTIHENKGSLSHHHGVGRTMAPWMEKELGPESIKLMQAIKNHLDPNGIMNPGNTLGLKP